MNFVFRKKFAPLISAWCVNTYLLITYNTNLGYYPILKKYGFWDLSDCFCD